MKIMFASDIHGSAYYCRKMVNAFHASEAERLVLLGDILYHGPRNDLPREYQPKEVIQMLNSLNSKIYAVRGNCDTEVDQMVLSFPIMADYALLCAGNTAIYATHGHVYHQDRLPPIQDGDILMYGHTHLLKAEWMNAEGIGTIGVVNPGSISIPKGGNPPTYGLLEDGHMQILTFDGEVVKEMDLFGRNG